MKTERKELVKKFNAVIKDLMDNYDKYTDEEKAQIKDIFQKVADLNTLLDKYDIDAKFDWNEYLVAYGHYFDPMCY
jgi:ABC-type transporter Mla subunit MlaD